MAWLLALVRVERLDGSDLTAGDWACSPTWPTDPFDAYVEENALLDLRPKGSSSRSPVGQVEAEQDDESAGLPGLDVEAGKEATCRPLRFPV